jgi:hypothetical protein
MHLWLVSHARHQRSQKPRVPDEAVDVFIAVCDHFEPESGGADKSTALTRVERWCADYPDLCSGLSDHDGRPPQHTVFFPQHQYEPEYLDLLADLCAKGYGDVEVLLPHHDGSPDALRDKLDEFRHTLFDRHGLLRRDPTTGEVVYGLIYRNGALCDSRPDSRWCGVNDEIELLKKTACYADFTMPTAPGDTQTRIINSIHYATQESERTKSDHVGHPRAAGIIPPQDGLLTVQGPLVLDWSRRRFGVMPRIENGELHAGRPASMQRFDLWMQANVHVAGRPDWVFVKLHTRGAKPGNSDMLLGPETKRFHEQLARRAERNPNFRYHYVTAWEMTQLIHTAENGLIAPKRATTPPSELERSAESASHTEKLGV